MMRPYLAGNEFSWQDRWQKPVVEEGEELCYLRALPKKSSANAVQSASENNSEVQNAQGEG